MLKYLKILRNNFPKYFYKEQTDKKINKCYNTSNPYFSIVSAVFNKEVFVINLIKAFQDQTYKNVELIIVDDCSKDYSNKIAKEYQNFDKRIVIIKNEKNRGTLYTRIRGAYNTRGKYLTLVEGDDMLLNPYFFEESFNISERYDADIIETNIYHFNLHGDNNITFGRPGKVGYGKLFNKNIYDILSGCLTHGHLFKNQLYIDMLKSIGNNTLNKRMIYFDDCITKENLYSKAKSYIKENINSYLTYQNREQNGKLTTRQLNEYCRDFFLYHDEIYKIRPKTKKNIEKLYKEFNKTLKKCKNILTEEKKKEVNNLLKRLQKQLKKFKK